MNDSDLLRLKELLSLASCQLEDNIKLNEDIEFAYLNVENALNIVIKYMKERKV